jgi:HAD superfamily hydrolase (TIGR01509 family)
LFDIDGTLVDSISAFLEVARCAALPHKLEVNERHVRLSLANGTNFWNGVVPDDHIDAAAIRKALSEHASREWPRVLREHGRVFEGLGDTLDALKQMGMVLGIVSGARPEVLELLDDVGILDHFDSIVLAADVTKRKPDPEGLYKCLKALGIKPADAVYVGDAPVDIQAGRAAGVHTVGVLTGAADSALLSAQEPDHLIQSHERLLAVIEPG